MTAQFIGVKKVLAWPEEKDGKAGYAVKYEDGYISWSPADVFERSYFELSDHEGSKLTENDINRFIAETNIIGLDSKTTLVKSTARSGFVDIEASSCVDPVNYDEAVGAAICLERIKNKLWSHLGFVLQWAKYGLSPEEKDI